MRIFFNLVIYFSLILVDLLCGTIHLTSPGGYTLFNLKPLKQFVAPIFIDTLNHITENRQFLRLVSIMPQFPTGNKFLHTHINN
jgi:hypothetical protein